MPRGLNFRAFTLVEVLASIVLITIGIVATLQTLGALTRADSRDSDSEEMQRLAIRKYDEIVAGGGLSTLSSSGDFQDLGDVRFTWKARQANTGTGNLDRLTIEIDFAGGTNPRKEVLSGLFCRPSKSGSGT